ncbi:serine/threonine-protein kinase Nek9 isoform X2 [Strongylocentrotus purpuratus]|uniref:non-specific serine/threonine protein kinase n=1 Tax=Strongylocentrotus purpuratus TaxID=7668 RepID=A0A7M7PV07_STRPU|nr:serine/threonine-protein kinase Nek9 isoform X2 [Strongylocentrotus purpuratus]
MAATEDGGFSSPSSTNFLPGGNDPIQEEMYTPVRVLGKGAFGEAVLYRKTEDNSLVVWKEVNLTRCSERVMYDAQNEIEILSMLNHANIISYFNHFLDDQSLFIEMEYANGGTLYEKIVHQDGTLFEEELVLWYLFQTVSAVAYIHQIDVLHRDIKTLNIFMTKSGLIKVGDFGISKVLGDDKMAESVVGTPLYMSPELVKGQQYNAKSDVWAIGCVLYELLTLRRVFEASNQLKVVWGIVQKEHEDIDERYSKEMHSLVTQLLAKDPENRPSAAEIMANPLLSDKKKERNRKVWELNGIVRRAKSQSSFQAETVPVVTFTNSEVFYWGGGRLTPLKLEAFKDGNRALQVAAGHSHFASVTVEKEIFTWANVHGGQALVGQLGHGDTACYKAPKKVEKLQGIPIKAVGCGEEFTACITDEGQVYTFGSDYYGCLGRGEDYEPEDDDDDDEEEVKSPILVSFFNERPVNKISCGDNHILALTKDEQVYSWGCGEFGRLGLGNEDDYKLPQKVTFQGKKEIKTVSAGSEGSFFLTTDGKVYACGSNEHNRLGFNTVTAGLRKRIVKECYDIPYKDIPTLVKPLNRYNIKAVSAGHTHSATIDNFGRLIMFGSNQYGQLGVGDCKGRSGICEVKGFLTGKHVVTASCGDGFTIIATTDNQIFSFGHVDSGRLGHGDDLTGSHKKKQSVSTPKPVFGSLHMVSGLSCRYWHTIIIAEKVVSKPKTLRSTPRMDSNSSKAVGQDGEKSAPNQTPERSSGSIESRPQESLKQEPSTNHTSGNMSHDEGLHTGDSGQETGGTGSMSQREETNGGGKDDDENGEDSAMPPWLKNELEKAEFIPMPTIESMNNDSTNSATPKVAAPPQYNSTAAKPPSGKPELDGSSCSDSGFQRPHFVPPLSFAALSQTEDNFKMGLAQDVEVEALRDRVTHLENENKKLFTMVSDQHVRLLELEKRLSQIEGTGV